MWVNKPFMTPPPPVVTDAKTRKSCNGHINNVHWSTYCDSGGAQKALAKNYVTGSTSSKYWNFHTHSSKKANANFLFYFR